MAVSKLKLTAAVFMASAAFTGGLAERAEAAVGEPDTVTCMYPV